MSDRLEQLLIECLDALERGETPAQILARYPQDAAMLRPMLETAVQIQQLPLQPTRAAQLASKDAFLSHATALQQARTARATPWPALRRLLAPVLALFLVALVGLSMVQASMTTLPGDALYGVKRLVEGARLTLAADAAAFELELQQVRAQEIRQLLALGRTAEVQFAGEITAVADMHLTIAGLETELTPQTQLTGTPALGLMAEVDGRTENGRLLATAIRIAAEDVPQPTPTPQPTETAVPPSITPTLPAPSPTATPTAQATPQPSPPAATPPPVSSVNDNSDDDNNNESDGSIINDNDNANLNGDGDGSSNDNANTNDDDDDDDNVNNDNDDDDDDNGD